MDKLKIIGGQPLSGSIRISGAKNAALPLMAASLLSEHPITLTNMPYLADITTLSKLLSQHGVKLSIGESTLEHGRAMTFRADQIDNLTAPYEIVRTMRASVLVLGPLLVRFGKARVSLPGGCAIGTRPVDLHLKALEQMGAEIEIDGGYIDAKAPNGLNGCDIHFEQVSVGATENILMAATLAKGQTRLSNAAREPEIGDLANLLVAMGAKIEGIGTSNLVIEGDTTFNEATHAVITDRIEAGSYLCLAAATRSELTLKGARAENMQALLEKLAEAGVETQTVTDGIQVNAMRASLQPVDITTHPHPGFPTDMQAQMMALLTLAQGSSSITETIFENRFMHVPELIRMGADITLKGQTAIIRGVEALYGAEVMATDLRASVSLVIAALAAKGETVINRLYHLDRGYERLEEKLSRCGAQIERVA